MAVMGSSLARNMARHGYRVALFNRTYSRTQQVVADHGSEGSFLPAETIEEFHFVGGGISGGEVGALEGPSIMPGGSQESYDALGPILEDISAHVGDEPCCTYIGTDGVGHFVKMVHNGIELSAHRCGRYLPHPLVRSPQRDQG